MLTTADRPVKVCQFIKVRRYLWYYLKILKIFTTDEIAANADCIYKFYIRPEILKGLKNEQKEMD